MRILIVEDDNDTADALLNALEIEGYAVDQAFSVGDARYLMQTFPYELAVLDLGLPDGEGLLLLQEWRHQGFKLPVLVLTGRDAWHERVDGLKAGADDYMGKPFHIEELVARLQALFRRAHGESTNQIQRGNLRLDEGQQCVWEGDQQLLLTGAEYRLLRYLMLHPAQLLSRQQLLEQLYDMDTEVASNVVEVYIRRLRKKMNGRYIHTRRGQGYLFSVSSS
jgi:two-component system, OmpR family, response regulator